LNQLICEATFWNDSVTFYQTLQEIDFLKATKKQYQRSHFIKAYLQQLNHTTSGDKEVLDNFK
jgi:hypothetical protein